MTQTQKHLYEVLYNGETIYVAADNQLEAAMLVANEEAATRCSVDYVDEVFIAHPSPPHRE